MEYRIVSDSFHKTASHEVASRQIVHAHGKTHDDGRHIRQSKDESSFLPQA